MVIETFVRQERRRQGLDFKELSLHSKVEPELLERMEIDAAQVPLEAVNSVLRALGYQLGIVRDFRPWDADYHPHSIEALPETETLSL